ncbi:MAG TPA: hypothetical protein VL614_06415 [Acetobacteraceae bacterium]|jgi:hypothetical protein|nr:hypothetical protein [Acetobacteraceae bacterium]
MEGYRILRSAGRFIVLITRADGTRRWSPWFANKIQAQAWIAEQSSHLPSAADA